MLIKILRILAIVVMFAFFFAWATHATMVRFGNPSLTETQILLQTWGWLVPMSIAALLVALLEYIAGRSR